MNLAIVVNTTDKYSYIWDAWYHYYKKYWTLELPVYFLNETLDITYPFKQIKINIPEVELWTKKLRESIEQIPEDNLFILLEDLLFTDGFYPGEFESIYQYFLNADADALRIQPKSKYTTTISTMFSNVVKLTQDSEYLIAHTPNIWKKEFLLKCIKHDEDPWTNEIIGTKRIQNKGFNIYHYRKEWFVNMLRHGRVVPKYKNLLQYNSLKIC